MADYKGYTIEAESQYTDAILSPFGDKIALIVKSLDGQSVRSLVDGVTARNDYKHRGEMLKDIVNQYLALIGEDEDERIITPSESRAIVIQTVKNLHINSNSVEVQVTAEQVETIRVAVESAEPDTLKRILKEWIPQAFLGAGIAKLVGLLGIVFG